jgi:hypothetical protein
MTPAASLELRKHINVVRDRLSEEFQPRVAPEVVSREVELAAAQFDGARITAYVPVLVNRQVRLRLRELVSAA